jgi:hypothetical protein
MINVLEEVFHSSLAAEWEQCLRHRFARFLRMNTFRVNTARAKTLRAPRWRRRTAPYGIPQEPLVFRRSPSLAHTPIYNALVREWSATGRTVPSVTGAPAGGAPRSTRTAKGTYSAGGRGAAAAWLLQTAHEPQTPCRIENCRAHDRHTHG